MSIIFPVNYQDEKGYYWYCPACKTHHCASLTKGWSWDGNLEKPTFSPSFLVRGVEMTPKGWADYNEWRDSDHIGESPESYETVDTVCHTFIRNGMIEYLSDCTHEYAGKTIPMEETEID